MIRISSCGGILQWRSGLVNLKRLDVIHKLKKEIVLRAALCLFSYFTGLSVTYLLDLKEFCICLLIENWCERVTFLLVFLWRNISLTPTSVTWENLTSM